MGVVKAAWQLRVSDDMNKAGHAPQARPQHYRKVPGIGWPWLLPNIATTPHADEDNNKAGSNRRSKASL